MQQPPDLMVVENFYDDPWKIREIAEKSEYFEDHDSGYFSRTKPYLSFGILNKLEKLCGMEIAIDQNWESSSTYNGSFYITSPNKPLPQHVHHDMQHMVGIVCLSSDYVNESLADGTCFWRHKATAKTKARSTLEVDPLSSQGKDLSRWVMTDFVSHKFNTLILYPGLRWHSARIGKLDRLNQLFVFNFKQWLKEN